MAVETILDRCFNKRVIVNCDHIPYLSRWYLIRNSIVGVFLHCFHRSDEERALHDHPWSFFVIILWRGYWEHYEVKVPCIFCLGKGHNFFVENIRCSQCKGRGWKWRPRKKRKWPGMMMYRPALWKHRVELIDGKPSWSLFIRFRKIRDWGFHTKDGWIQWNKWWQNNCE